MAYKPVRNLVSRFITTFTGRLSPKPATNAASTSSFAVQFLTSSCGLSSESALLVSRGMRLEEKHITKPESVLKFLKSNGFSDIQICKLIQKWPQVLHCKVEGNLKPKFEFFVRHGFAGKILSELMLSKPLIFQRALHSHIQCSFEFLKWLFSEQKVVDAVMRRPWLLVHDFRTCQPNIDYLLKEGVPLDRIGKLLLLNVRAAMRKHDSVVFAMNALKDLGLQPTEPMFIHGLRVLLFMNPSIWKERVEMMKSMGWSEEEIISAFLRFPYFISGSERKLRRAMDFYMNTMKLGRERIVTNPVWLSLSIDKRVLPRFNVLRALQSRTLIIKNKKIGPLLQMSEKKFLEKYVTKFEDKIPGLLQIYQQGKTI